MKIKIIQFLKKAQGHISGEEISKELKISRAAIWKYMQELRKEGYEITAVPHLGYRLEASPDKLLPREIQYKLPTKILGKDIIHYDSIGSTMDVAFKLGVEGAKEGTVVCAETQTKGKGRLGRSWSSPKGKGIYMSIILRPQLVPADAARLTLLSAVAFCEAVKNVTGVTATIKWPNDLLVKGQKFAGILTEMSAELDRVRFVIVGVGVNVNTPASLLPKGATSLKIETKSSVSRVMLVQEMLSCLERWYDLLKQDGFDSIIKRWKQLSSTLGNRIKILDPRGEVEGEAIDLDKDGGLVIKKDSGMAIKRMSGDVIHV